MITRWISEEKGFTLLELLLASTISSLVVVVGVVFIFQAFYTTIDARNHNTILAELDVATSQIRQDLYMAQSTDLIDGVPKNSIHLEWTNYAGVSITSVAVSYSCNYTLSGTDLIRSYGDGETAVESIIARHITDIAFTQSGGFIDVDITAASGSVRPVSKSVEFAAYRRSSGVQ